MTFPRAIAMMSKAYSAPPPPPPPPPPALSISSSSVGESVLPNGGPGGRVFTSPTITATITNDGGVPVTNPQYYWLAYYDLGSGPLFCGVSGQGTPSVQFTTGGIPDNSVVSILYACNLDDLDRPGRSANSGGKNWIVRTEYTP